MKEKLVLIGAGSAMFTRGLVADLVKRGQQAELALVDVDAKALAVAKGLAEKMIALTKAPITVAASTDRREVLAGATAVICTVGVGGRRAWEQDVFIPRRYGIFQPVGDSVMPGGTSRALRMIPAMVDIARDVLDLAPDALFFNYGNPMAPVCRAVRKATGADMVGLCHGVHDVAQYLAGALEVNRSRFSYSAVGMNHFTWFTEVRVDGQDARPRLRAVAARKLAQPPAAGAEEEDPSPFSWQLLLLFGAFPACQDRHVTEFFPHCFGGQSAYFGRTLGIDAYSFEQTIAGGDRIYEEMSRIATSPGPLPQDYLRHFSGEHEQVIEIIDAIRGGGAKIYSANLPNKGQVPNLPTDAIIEAPAVTTTAGLRAVTQPPLPAALAGALATRLAWVEVVVEAALEGSRDKFIQALMLDGAVPSIDTAARLADELLAAQAAYLPQFATA